MELRPQCSALFLESVILFQLKTQKTNLVTFLAPDKNRQKQHDKLPYIYMLVTLPKDSPKSLFFFNFLCLLYHFSLAVFLQFLSCSIISTIKTQCCFCGNYKIVFSLYI